MSAPRAFGYQFGVVFRVTFGVGAGIIVLALVIGGLGGAFLPMLVVSVLLALCLLVYAGTNARRVQYADGHLQVRTGLGRTFSAPLYDVHPRLRAERGGRLGISCQVTLRMPGQRYGITVPKYPPSSTIGLINKLREARPNIFESS